MQGSTSIDLVISGIQCTNEKEKGAENIYVCRWKFVNLKERIKMELYLFKVRYN